MYHTFGPDVCARLSNTKAPILEAFDLHYIFPSLLFSFGVKLDTIYW